MGKRLAGAAFLTLLTSTGLLSVSSQVTPARAEATPTTTVATDLGFRELLDKLKASVKDTGMLAVYSACASCAASQRGIEIPGNAVVGVYRNDFAVRMLQASVAAGIEAPIEFMVIGNDDETASLVYQMPSDVFSPYGHADLDAMAEELDAIWLEIIEATTGE